MQSEPGAQPSPCQLQAGPSDASQVASVLLCRTARAIACTQERPPINRSFSVASVASGWFRSQNRHCSWRPGATRAKGGERRPKPDLSYILATYFVSASLSIERVKGIEPSSQACFGLLHALLSWGCGCGGRISQCSADWAAWRRQRHVRLAMEHRFATADFRGKPPARIQSRNSAVDSSYQ